MITVEALAERVSQGLRDAIISGVLQPGERLVEERIAAQMGVSRAPVREALAILEREGLITSLPRRGVTVAVLTRQDVQEIYSLRSALECQAGRAACRKITPDDVEELLALAGGMRQPVGTGARQKLAAEDLAFHQRILEIAANKRLLKAWLGIISQVRLLQRHVLAAYGVDVADMALRHEAIVEVLRSGDPDRAERCLRDHIETTAHEVFESFPDAEENTVPGRARGATRRPSARRNAADEVA
jgi:DNA-binding GntR family transcriptional regulator